jgi:cbb3-type cytochrome oxidase cytochrome c subunit
MKNYTLVIVSARSIVVREYTAYNHSQLITEACECQNQMRHTLVLVDNSVVFESIRGQHEILKKTVIKDMLSNPKEIRVLSEREIHAIEKVHFRAI